MGGVISELLGIYVCEGGGKEAYLDGEEGLDVHFDIVSVVSEMLSCW